MWYSIFYFILDIGNFLFLASDCYINLNSFQVVLVFVFVTYIFYNGKKCKTDI